LRRWWTCHRAAVSAALRTAIHSFITSLPLLIECAFSSTIATKLPGFPHCFGTAAPCGNFGAASRASSACASKSKTTVCSACVLLRRRERRTFGPLGARTFHSVNRRRNSLHHVAPATLEHAVLESSDAGVYTLQVHAIPALRAWRTFGQQQLRQCTSAHGSTPNQLRLH
jgi:hypothetical protein